MTVIFPGGDFSILYKTVVKKVLAGNIPVIKSSLSFFWCGREGGGRREEEGGGEVGTFRAVRWQLLWTYRAPHHIQTPQSWTPCLLISALYSVCWCEGKRREEWVEGKKRRKKRKRKNKSKSKSKRRSKRKRKRKRRERRGRERERERERKREEEGERARERECAKLHHTPHTRTTRTQQHTHHHHQHHIQHHMYTHNPHTRQPTVISRVSSSREKWMLGYVLTSQPTVILREFQCECLDVCLSDNRPWSWDEKVNAWICANVTFYF